GGERRPSHTGGARLQLAAERGGQRRQRIDLHAAGQLGRDDEAVRRDDEGAADAVQPLQLLDDVAHVAPARGAVVLERELEAWSAHEILRVGTAPGVSAGVDEGAAAGGPAASPSSCCVADHSRFTSSRPCVGSVARGSASETMSSPSVRVKTASRRSSTIALCSGPSTARAWLGSCPSTQWNSSLAGAVARRATCR